MTPTLSRTSTLPGLLLWCWPLDQEQEVVIRLHLLVGFHPQRPSKGGPTLPPTMTTLDTSGITFKLEWRSGTFTHHRDNIFLSSFLLTKSVGNIPLVIYLLDCCLHFWSDCTYVLFRCCRTYEEVHEGDIGKVVKLDLDGLHDLNVQVEWQRKGVLYWVRYIHIELLHRSIHAVGTGGYNNSGTNQYELIINATTTYRNVGET